MPSRSDDEFFVGYLATPPGLGRMLHRAVAVLALLALLTAVVIASRQRDPGDGQWATEVTRYTGTLITKPYPMLQLDDGGTLLLVNEGKSGAVIPGDAREGQRARVHGTIIQRGSLRILEVEHAIELQSTASTSVAPEFGADVRPFHGEIIDPKCFAGAMKPGQGKTHKACAALCIRGGIPPAFVTDSGEIFLLTGGSLDQFIAHVGEVVELRGRAGRIGEIPMIEVTQIVTPASK